MLSATCYNDAMIKRDWHGRILKGSTFSNAHKKRLSESRKKYISDHPEIKIQMAERMKQTVAEGKAGFPTGNKLRVGATPWNKGKTARDDPRIYNGLPWNYKGGKHKCKDCGKQLGGYQTKNKLCAKCFGLSIRGKNAPHWKGGITPESRAARLTTEYKEWRKAVFERDDYSCQLCGARGVPIQADHIKSFAEYPELRTVLSNGRTLCKPCHSKTPSFCRNIK